MSKHHLWLMLTCFAAATIAAIGTHPRYIEELRIGGGYGEPVNGGADFLNDGTIRTDGTIRAPEFHLVDVSLTDDGTPESTLYLQRATADVPSRLYVMPNGDPGQDTRSAVKVFFDDFAADNVNFRDTGLVASESLASSTGGGVFHLNSKANGDKDNPDIAFTFQDTNVAGRWIHNDGDPALIVGSATELTANTNRIQIDDGDLAMANNRFVRWRNSSGQANSGFRFNNANAWEFISLGVSVGTLASNGDLTVDGAAQFDGNEVGIGDAGGFSGIKFNPASTQLEFWIDGDQVAHIGTNGTYVNDVP